MLDRHEAKSIFVLTYGGKVEECDRRGRANTEIDHAGYFSGSLFWANSRAVLVRVTLIRDCNFNYIIVDLSCNGFKKKSTENVLKLTVLRSDGKHLQDLCLSRL